MTSPKMPTHPDARCGRCNACQYVESTKQIVLAHSAPAGPGITQRETDLWNNALLDNPCEQPLVIVNLRNPPATVRARLLKDNGGDHEAIQIMTVEYGPLYVDRIQVVPWIPSRCLDGINFENLTTALENMPSTWYPALFDAVTRGAHSANTFAPFGASATVRRLEIELLGSELNDSLLSSFVAARASIRGDELKTVLTDLLNTTELNLDEMEPHTRDVIDRATALISEIETGK